MSRRLLMAAAIVLAGMTSIVDLKPVQAATTPSTFNGNVAKACFFGTPTDGTLTAAKLSNPSMPDVLLAGFNGSGIVATVNVSCNDDFNVTVKLPMITSAPAGLNPSQYQCGAYAAASSFARIDGQCGLPLTATSRFGADQTVNAETLRVGAYIWGRGTALPAGNYTMTVDVAATPN